jgi:hypothetical protein
MNGMRRKSEETAKRRAYSSFLQGYPDENEESRTYLSFREYGKPQLYGRAVATVQAPAPFLTHDAGPESSTSTKTE